MDKPDRSPPSPRCRTDPRAPHGFLRNASHNAQRYVCECELWEPPAAPVPAPPAEPTLGESHPFSYVGEDECGYCNLPREHPIHWRAAPAAEPVAQQPEAPPAVIVDSTSDAVAQFAGIPKPARRHPLVEQPRQGKVEGAIPSRVHPAAVAPEAPRSLRDIVFDGSDDPHRLAAAPAEAPRQHWCWMHASYGNGSCPFCAAAPAEAPEHYLSTSSATTQPASPAEAPRSRPSVPNPWPGLLPTVDCRPETTRDRLLGLVHSVAHKLDGMKEALDRNLLSDVARDVEFAAEWTAEAARLLDHAAPAEAPQDDDLVARLNQAYEDYTQFWGSGDLYGEAAARIESDAERIRVLQEQRGTLIASGNLSNPVYTPLGQIVKNLEAALDASRERERALREALRAETVRCDQPIYNNKWMVVGWHYQCGVCEQTWSDEAIGEQHAPGCLATPDSAASPTGGEG